jgi:hypothetical protein
MTLVTAAARHGRLLGVNLPAPSPPVNPDSARRCPTRPDEPRRSNSTAIGDCQMRSSNMTGIAGGIGVCSAAMMARSLSVTALRIGFSKSAEAERLLAEAGRNMPDIDRDLACFVLGPQWPSRIGYIRPAVHVGGRLRLRGGALSTDDRTAPAYPPIRAIRKRRYGFSPCMSPMTCCDSRSRSDSPPVLPCRFPLRAGTRRGSVRRATIP